ncbi:MAG TPA: class I SAM-dependent methyltransferase [Anaerolineae bacterium]|nr:class I SAM-dependent methyltransferase [Anaerolineae bacterium]
MAKSDPTNTWLSGDAQGETYVATADVIIVERRRTTKLLLDLFRYHFGDRQQGRHILDLGCGDGAITEQMRHCQPDNVYHLLDGSAAMLDKARQRLPGETIHFIQQTFEAYLDRAPEDAKYDGIFSSNAIHHLDFFDKGRMYAKVYRELKIGGLFVNIDVVRPTSERSEQWQFQMWVDWIDETLRRNGMESEVGIHDQLPAQYKRKPENKPSALFDQLELLHKMGFRDVDCFYKYGIFAVFGGVK